MAYNPNQIPARTSERVGYHTPPTPEQIGHAATFGIDLRAQDKYFAQVQLDNRDQGRPSIS